MHEFDSWDGAVLIDKPAGPTSHDVVDAFRRNFAIKKVGHCGTLDPAATGLLVLVLGRATKLSEKLMSDDKVYEGCAKFGETTDSYDADGELVASLPVPPMTLEEINQAIKCRRRPWFRRSRSKACPSTKWRAKASKWNANPG
jgi:tRNA pseudouridine55 synthase